MAKPEGQLEALRALYDGLSQQVSRFTLIRLAVLVFCVFTFSSAFHRVQSGDIAETAQRIVTLNDYTYYKIQFSGVCSLQGTCVSASSSETKLPGGCLSEEQLQTRSPLLNPLPTPDQLTAEGQRQHLLRTLDDKCTAAYSPTLTALGSSIQVDLRGWIFAFPSAFLISETYLQILRRKRRIVGSAAAHLLVASTPKGDDGVAYKMLFAGVRGAYGPFGRYPSQFADTIYAVCALGLAVKFGVESSRAWGDYYTQDVSFYFLDVFLVTASYCLVYYRAVSKRLGNHLLQCAGIAPVPDWSESLRTGLQKLGRVVLPRRRRSVLAGTLLVLSTLYIATCMSTCGDAVPGYRLVALQRSVSWATFPDAWRIQSLLYYLLGLSFALASLGLLILSISKPRTLQRRGLIEGLWIVARALGLYGVLDFASAGTPIRSSVAGVAAVFAAWLLPMILWSVFYLRRANGTWGRVRGCLLALYSPIIPLILFSGGLAAGFGFYGLICYALGLSLLWRGYTDLRAELQPPSTAPFERSDQQSNANHSPPAVVLS